MRPGQLPLVELGASFFMHTDKSIGKVHTPVLSWSAGSMARRSTRWRMSAARTRSRSMSQPAPPVERASTASRPRLPPAPGRGEKAASPPVLIAGRAILR